MKLSRKPVNLNISFHLLFGLNCISQWYKVQIKYHYKTKNPNHFRLGFSKERRRTESYARTRRSYKQKTPTFTSWGFQKKGDDILSHKIAVPSALAGLTTLFGMGRGEPRRNNHLKILRH